MNKQSSGSSLLPVAGLSGLELLRGFIAAGKGPPIGLTLGFTLVEAEPGRVVFAGTPAANTYNPLGVVHGGWAATLLDSACGCAVHSQLSAKQTYTTLELKVAFHKSLTTETGLVRATGTVVSLGRRVGFAAAQLTDASGRLYASATSTLLVMEQG
jgi:uncharacterized protein (TIGR00369 family)